MFGYRFYFNITKNHKAAANLTAIGAAILAFKKNWSFNVYSGHKKMINN